MRVKAIIALLSVTALTACGNIDAAHLVFGQQQTVGLDISATPETGGTLSLGYKDKNIAIIPVVISNNGVIERLGSTNNESADADKNDAYSTLGQFELKAATEGGTVSVGLGKFFATGIAAQNLSEGFKAKLAK